MGSIRLFILWVQWAVLRRPSVILFDSDGEMNARLARGPRKYRYVDRYNFGIRRVNLLPHGAISPDCYVRRWEPLFPANFSI